MKADFAFLKTARAYGNRVMFYAKKHNPEIALTAGIVGSLAAAFMACKATMKVNEVVSEHKENIEKIEEAGKQGCTVAGLDYSEEDKRHDLQICYIQTGVKLVKLYGPSILLETASVASLITFHKIMKGRNAALAATCAALAADFKAYRGRVVDRFGEIVDHELKYDVKAVNKKTKVVDAETGEVVSETEKQFVKNHEHDIPSGYARYFEEWTRTDDGVPVRNWNWKKNNEYNMQFLLGQEREMNHLLAMQGYLFLNDVYAALGLPKSVAGQSMGWIYDPKVDGKDGYVSFGLHKDSASYSDFIYGNDNGILLDFNVDDQPILNFFKRKQ